MSHEEYIRNIVLLLYNPTAITEGNVLDFQFNILSTTILYWYKQHHKQTLLTSDFVQIKVGVKLRMPSIADWQLSFDKI